MYASANIIPFSFGEIVYESELQIVTETSPSYIPVIYSPSESLQMVRKASFQNNFSKKSFFSISKRIFLEHFFVENFETNTKASSFDDIGEKMTSVVIVRNQGKTPAKDIDVTIKIPTVRCSGLVGRYTVDSTNRRVLIKSHSLNLNCHLRWSKMTTYFMWCLQK